MRSPKRTSRLNTAFGGVESAMPKIILRPGATALNRWVTKASNSSSGVLSSSSRMDGMPP